MSVNEKMTALADAFRSALDNVTRKLGLDDMVSCVAELKEAGYEQGKSEEWSAAWDEIQQFGTRVSYASAFYGWSGDYFYPKYDIVLTSASNMFQQFGEIDLAERLEQCGVKLDFSNFTAETYMIFYQSKITRLPVLDFRKISGQNQTFRESKKLKTIDGIIYAETTKHSTLDFFQCSELENLTVMGTIGLNGFSVSACSKLTHDSLMSIINALKDYSTDTSGTAWKVTIGATNKAKLTEEELYLASQKGWTVS